MSDYLKDFKRLAGNPFSWLTEGPESPAVSYLGGQADLTPLRNKAREAMDALADLQRAADVGKVDDAYEALRRAKAAIDAALGGQIGPYAPGMGGPPTNHGSPGGGALR